MTDAIDDTIRLLNDKLEKAESLKDFLSITDRIIRCQSLKLKFTNAGKGGKFAALEEAKE